jgi:hypothetical protein
MGFHEVDGTNVENRAEDDHHSQRKTICKGSEHFSKRTIGLSEDSE